MTNVCWGEGGRGGCQTQGLMCTRQALCQWIIASPSRTCVIGIWQPVRSLTCRHGWVSPYGLGDSFMLRPHGRSSSFLSSLLPPFLCVVVMFALLARHCFYKRNGEFWWVLHHTLASGMCLEDLMEFGAGLSASLGSVHHVTSLCPHPLGQ